MKKPVIHPSAFVADNATVRGSVALGANSSVFFGAVLRGDRRRSPSVRARISRTTVWCTWTTTIR